MDISLILKIASIGILLGILNIILDKADKKEFSFIVTLVGVIMVLSIVINLISSLFNSLRTIFQL